MKNSWLTCFVQTWLRFKCTVFVYGSSLMSATFTTWTINGQNLTDLLQKLSCTNTAARRDRAANRSGWKPHTCRLYSYNARGPVYIVRFTRFYIKIKNVNVYGWSGRWVLLLSVLFVRKHWIHWIIKIMRNDNRKKLWAWKNFYYVFRP